MFSVDGRQSGHQEFHVHVGRFGEFRGGGVPFGDDVGKGKFWAKQKKTRKKT